MCLTGLQYTGSCPTPVLWPDGAEQQNRNLGDVDQLARVPEKHAVTYGHR
jgi:hypothetical protein